jgi:hypothetical protein
VVLLGLSFSERLENLRVELAVAVLRHEWAVAEAERSSVTPALTRFIGESCKECGRLQARLDKLTRILSASKPRKK